VGAGVNKQSIKLKEDYNLLEIYILIFKVFTKATKKYKEKIILCYIFLYL